MILYSFVDTYDLVEYIIHGVKQTLKILCLYINTNTKEFYC